MEFENALKSRKISNDNFQMNPEIKRFEANLMDLPTENLQMVASFLPKKMLMAFGLVNKKCQQIHQLILSCGFTKGVDLTKYCNLNEKKILELAKNINFKSVNLSHCYSLSPDFIREIVCKQSVVELDLIECNCSLEVIKAVAKLNLTSLAISLSVDWRNFFRSNDQKSLSFLNGLKKMEVFHELRAEQMMSHVSRYVLTHCHQLQHLKLFTPVIVLDVNTANNDFYEIFKVPQFTPTPVPLLESLILDFNIEEKDLSRSIKLFLDVILHGKTVPLTNIYLGKQMAKAVLSGILSRKDVSFNEIDTLCLSTNSCITDELAAILNMQKQATKNMIHSTQYQKIQMENLMIEDLTPFNEMFFASGNTAIKEVSFRHSMIEEGLYNFMVQISNLCSGITLLDLSLAKWPVIEDNRDMLIAFSNLTNLQTLCIIPSMLKGYPGYVTEECLRSSFMEVTKKCENLEHLRIVSVEERPERISKDVLSCIKCIKNLQELHLVNFTSAGQGRFLLEIAESCNRLKYLYIKDIGHKTGFEELLAYVKQIKHLYIEQSFKMTKTFADNLSACNQLQKLCIFPLNEKDDNMNKYLAKSLIKLKKLQIFSAPFASLMLLEHFKSANKKIKDKRPSFFFHRLDALPLPVIHRDILQYTSHMYPSMVPQK